MAWVDTVNQTNDGGNGVSSPVVAIYPNNCVSGSLLLGAITYGSGLGTVSLSDSVNGSWSRAVTITDGTNSQILELWYFNGNTSVLKPVVTGTLVGAGAMALAIWEKTGQATSSIIDGTPGTNNPGTGSITTNGDTCGSITTAVDGDLIVGVIFDDFTVATLYTAGTSPFTFTNRPDAWILGGPLDGALQTEDGVQITHGAVNPTFTASSPTGYVAVSAAFKPSAGVADILFGQGVL